MTTKTFGINFRNMLKTSIQLDECCGCGGCAQICPTGALTMERNADGFPIPILNSDKCVDCKLCQTVCPINKEALKKLPFNQANFAVAGIHKNVEIADESSSGGAFSAISQAFAKNGDCVFFGAEMLEDFSVKHRKAETLDEIASFRKSKYIPSDTAETFKQAKDFLKKGRRVLFSGTPCQIASLKLFVGEKLQENLLTIDFSCHGVGNPFVWKKYLSDIEKKYGKKIVRFDFRAKSKSLAMYSSQSSRTIFADGSELVKFKDSWFKGFVSALFKRESCKGCPFSQPQRISDITIADFWGIERISGNWNSGKGVSLILLNTQKAICMYDDIATFAKLEKFPFEECLKYNVPLREKVSPHKDCAKFRELLKSSDFETALWQTLGYPTFLQRTTELFLRFFPIRTQHTITRLTKRTTGFVKIVILKVLPKTISSKIMGKWASINGRKYIEEKTENKK